MTTVAVVVPTMGSGWPVALVIWKRLESAFVTGRPILFMNPRPAILQALPESGRAATVCLTPWRERWSLGVAPCTASRTFTVATSTWSVVGVWGVGVAAGGGLSSHNSLSASASGAASAAETVLTGAFLGVSFGLYEELLRNPGPGEACGGLLRVS